MIQSPALPWGLFEAGAVDVVGALVGAGGGVVADDAPTPADAVSAADAAMTPAVLNIAGSLNGVLAVGSGIPAHGKPERHSPAATLRILLW